MAKESFGRMSARLALLLAVLASFVVSGVAWAADRIGVASAVVNKVSATLSGAITVLRVGDSLFQDQVVETEVRSTTQLLFQDETALTVGPNSRVVLDTYVYNPNTRTGNIVLNATKGAFRFVSGSAQSSTYKIRTPTASIGVRGTIFSWLITPLGDVLAVCEEGEIEGCNNAGQCLVAGPGQALLFKADGTIEGPFSFNDPTWQFINGIQTPVFGYRFANDQTDFPTRIDTRELNDALDNANRVIIAPPSPPPVITIT